MSLHLNVVLAAAAVLVAMCASSATAQCFSTNDTVMKVSEQARQQLLHSQLQFSADLLQAVAALQPTDNLFFSPSSIFNALLLTYFAAANHTEASIKDTLKLSKDQEKADVWGAYSFEKYCHNMRTIKGALMYKLTNANRLYVSDEEQIRPCIKKLFGKEIEAVDFRKNNSAVVTKINDWVATQTRNNIQDLLSTDSLNDNTNLVLANAAYFRGFWKYEFSPSSNTEEDFRLSNGTTVPVTMLTLESNFSQVIYEDFNMESLEMPYVGDDISMFVLLPLNRSPTAVPDLIKKMDAAFIQAIVDNSTATTPADISLAVPKFTVDKTLQLTQVLESMGVGDLFRSSADLSTLTGAAGLRLDTAIHKAKVTVDEKGTEAAAATAVFANRFAANSFVANHPFVYFIFDKKANVLLFVGVFNSPES